MNRKIRTLGLMVLVIVILGIAALILRPQQTDGSGSVAMLDIGQGDSFLIQSASGTQLLIDGGKDSKVLSELSKAMPTGDHTIDVVIATHPDADHIGGLPMVLERYNVGLFLTSEVTSDSQVFRDLNVLINEKHIPAYYARRGMTLALDDETSFKVLFPDRDTTGWETNTASVVGRLDMSGRSMLLNGDSPISIEQYLVQHAPRDIDVDILKLGHHGSKTSSSSEFLKATSPILALISAGVNNRYGHPAPIILDRLKELHIPWVSTQQHGLVTFTTDGTKWVEKDEK